MMNTDFEVRMVLEEITTITLIICPLSKYYSSYLPSSHLILLNFMDEVSIKPNFFPSVSKESDTFLFLFL